MRKPDTAFKSILLAASVVLLASSTWAVKTWQQFTATAITGVAFYDCNSNGIRDNNEAAFDGMPVMLTGQTSAGEAIRLVSATDDMGNYSFVLGEPATFAIKFLFPSGATALSFTTKNTAANGSDVDSTGETDSLTVDGIMNVQGVDAGIIDRTAPVVTFVNPFLTPYANGDTITVECDSLPTMNTTWATATDNSGKAVRIQFIDLAISTNDCARRGYITILDCIFRATDACGNVGEKSVFVKVRDSKAPVLAGVPADITVNTLNAERVPAPFAVTSTDNCATNAVPATLLETEAVNTCGKVITRTWSASDDCGNLGRGTQRITVISNATCGGGGGNPVGDTVRLTLRQGVTLDTCLAFATGSVLSNIQHCGAGQPSATITLTSNNCIRVVPSVNFVGRDTFCARICDSAGLNCRDIKFFINVQAARLGSCDILGSATNVNLMSSVCGENACFCVVGTSIGTLRDDYTVTDNGRIYDGGFSGCQFDTIFSYNYFAVPVMGSNGPYRLDSWQVNGTTRMISMFQSVQELTDSMNRWDPMGNWRIDASRFLIYGGDMRSQYGQMKITRLSNSAFGLLELNTGLISNGAKMCFSRGLHTVIFQNNTSGCADTLRANVFCSDIQSAPIAVDDRITTTKNTTVRIAATINDTLNGVFESLVSLGQPAHGSVGFQNAQTFLYTPNTDYCGRDTFDYRVCNAFGLCDTARVFVETTCNTDTTGGGTNRRRPLAIDDVVNARKNTAKTFSVLANDILNGALVQPLSIIRFQTNGSVNIVNNEVTYTPSTDFCDGRDSFDYQICNADGCDTGRVVINVSCEADTTTGGGNAGRPVAVDDVATTRKNTAVTIAVLANDTLNGTLTRAVNIVRFQMHGAVNIIDNQIVYTPSTDFCDGKDTLEYEICNVNGCDIGRVIINVTCQGDTMTGGGMKKPVAVNDVASTLLNTAVTISPLLNDTLNGALTRPLSIVRSQMSGTVSVINNQIIYTPSSGFCNARDSFDYEICNAAGCATARVVVTVICESDTTGGNGSRRPIAFDDAATTRLNTPITISILSNDSLYGALTAPISIVRFQTNGTVNIFNNQIIYTPSLGFCGSRDTFEYAICTLGGCDTARVVVNVLCENDGSGRPVAVDDRAKTRLDSRVTIPVLANDILNGFLTRSIAVIDNPRHGSSMISNNQIVYTPDATFCGGYDTLNYEICNAVGCDTASVVIEVTCSNDTTNGGSRRKPVAVDDRVLTNINTTLTILPLANDTLNGVLTRPLSTIGSPRHGTVFLMGNQIVYMPETGFCGGNDTLNYEICNVNGCDTAQIIIEVSCDNARPKPVATDDVATTRLNTPVTVSVLANDVLNGTLSVPVRIVVPQKHGVASVVNNQIIYTPSAGYCNDKDTLDYEICNGNGCDTARLIIAISCDTANTGGGSGRVVVAVNDNITTRKNTSITFNPTTNDTIRTKLLALSIITSPRNGAIAFRGLDTLLYTPNNNFCGLDTLEYTICDTSFVCASAFIFINVTCTSDTAVGGGETRKPVALNDFATTQKGRPVTVGVLTNDNTFGALTRPVVVTVAPRNGTASVVDNQIVYTPNPTFCGGQDTLTYEICNVNGCATANLFVAVSCDTTVTGGGSTRPVVAVNDNITTRKNTSITFKPTTNDTVQTKLLSLSIINAPRNGTIAFRGLDTLLYTPNFGFCGLDTLQYTICDTSFRCAEAFIFVNVTCATDTTVGGDGTRKPIALNDFVTTQKGRPITIAVLGNDSTYGVLTRPVAVTTAPRNGTTSVLNNQIVYTPNPTFCGGQDSLIYEICNANGCDTAKVYVAVTCDTTVTSGGSTRPVVAVNDNITTRKNTQVSLFPTLNDTIRTRLLALMIINAPRNGTISFVGLDTLIYAPNRDFCGRDTLQYSICDTSFNCASAFIYVNVTCDSTGGNLPLPIAVNDTARTQSNQAVVIDALLNDTLNGVLRRPLSITGRPRFGTATVNASNQIVYTPQNGFCGGRDTITYEICNANGCATAIVSVNVVCDSITATRQPIAVPDYATTRKRTPIRIPILVNDTLNGTLDSIRIISLPSRGIATIGTDNVLTYASDTCGFSDTLIYKICNRNGCDTALVVVKVTCQADTTTGSTLSPVAIFDAATTRKNTPIRIPILANDTLNGTLDSIKIIRSPLLGIASLGSDNVLTYTPDSCGFTDSLIYQICNRNGCDTAIVRIKVTCDTAIINDLAPVAVFDTARTAKGQAVTIRVTLNDTLRGADTFRITRSPIHGLAMFDSLRQIAYKPDSTYCGNDTLIYEICNARGCDTALVTISVTCDVVIPTIRPVAVDDYVKTIINRQVDFLILGNDTLRGARFAEMVSPPSHGTIIIMPDSMAMYKPDKEFCGLDSFMYRICNAAGCDTAIVRVDVSCGDTLQVFRGFSPNNDGKNDKLVIRGIENYPDNEVIIMNRWGNQVFSQKGYRNEEGWDGSWNSKYAPDGTYFYCIRLNDPKNQQFTGYIQLMR